MVSLICCSLPSSVARSLRRLAAPRTQSAGALQVIVGAATITPLRNPWHHGYDAGLSSSLREFLHCARLSPAELIIYPDEYGFRGYDVRDLGFPQYLVLHTLTLDRISLFRVRTRHRQDDGCFVRFLLQALVAPALQNVVVRLKIDDEYSILYWEPEQPNWAALDDGLAQCSQLEQVRFEFSLASSHVDKKLAKRAMGESMNAIPQLLPSTHSEG